MLGPTRYQTLEWRGPKGSNNPDEIMAWVEFINNVAKAANRKNIQGVKFSDLIKTERIAAYVAKLPKTRKLTDTELNQRINVRALA